MKSIPNLIISLLTTLNPTLAGILDKMKAKNPVVWAIAVLLLGSAFFAIQFLEKQGIISADTAMVLQTIDLVVLAATGSRTRDILKENSDANSN